jgi:hypothetical protein
VTDRCQLEIWNLKNRAKAKVSSLGPQVSVGGAGGGSPGEASKRVASRVA